MTSISHHHFVELKTSSSSSSSLLSTTSTSSSSDNEKSPICKVTNSPCIEDLSSEKHPRKRKRNTRNTSFLKLPDFPVKSQCPNCRKYIVTHLKYKNGTCVYIIAMGLFVLTVVLFWVPFFMDCCKDVTHFCPSCKFTLGTRRRI